MMLWKMRLLLLLVRVMLLLYSRVVHHVSRGSSCTIHVHIHITQNILFTGESLGTDCLLTT